MCKMSVLHLFIVRSAMSRITAIVVIILLVINDSQHQQYDVKILTKIQKLKIKIVYYLMRKKILHIPGRQSGSLQFPSIGK